MKLDEALSLASDRLRPLLRQDRERVALELTAMQNAQASSGAFLSGATIKKTRAIAIAAIHRRVEFCVATLKTCVLQVSPSVSDVKPLMDTMEHFLPATLDDLHTHINAIVLKINAPNTLAPALDPVVTARLDELQKAEVDLKLYLKQIHKAPERGLSLSTGISCISFATNLVLSVLWVMDPGGPYEPWLALNTVVSVGLLGFLAWKSRR